MHRSAPVWPVCCGQAVGAYRQPGPTERYKRVCGARAFSAHPVRESCGTIGPGQVTRFGCLAFWRMAPRHTRHLMAGQTHGGDEVHPHRDNEFFRCGSGEFGGPRFSRRRTTWREEEASDDVGGTHENRHGHGGHRAPAPRAREIGEAQVAIKCPLQRGSAGEVVSTKRDAPVLMRNRPLDAFDKAVRPGVPRSRARRETATCPQQ